MWGECVYTGLTGCVPGQERDCQGTYAFGQECINGAWGSCVLRQQCGNGGYYVNCNEENGFLLYNGICVYTRISGNIENGFAGFSSYADCQSASKSVQTSNNGITGGVITQAQNQGSQGSNNFLFILISITTILIVFLICLTIIIIRRKK